LIRRAVASEAIMAVTAGVAAVLFAAIIVRPFEASIADPDAAASVLFFDRILRGQRLEIFLPTTPKPFLTLLYGATFNLTSDWRLPTFEALAAFGVAVAAAVRLGSRLGGPAAGAVAGIALASSVELVFEVARANSVAWALAGWLVAGVALTEMPRRPWIAGIALLVAASCRAETYLLLGPVTIALATMAARGGSARREARAGLPILVGLLALPIASLHDLLLNGNPSAWIAVPAGYTAIVTPDLASVSPPAFLLMVAERYAERPLLTGLAAAGMVVLARRRHWAILGGSAALTVGIVALLGFIAWRGVFIAPRYFEQVDLALIVPAAVAVGIGVDEIRRGSGRAALAGAAMTAALAIALAWPIAPVDRGLAGSLDTLRHASSNAAAVVPELRSILATAAGPPPEAIPGPSGLPVTDLTRVPLYVPRSQLARLAVDLGVSLTELGDNYLAFRDRGPLAVILPGQVVYHDRYADRNTPVALLRPLEITSPVEQPGFRLVPIQVDPSARIWIVAAELR
jgi:hypothetical protein